MHLRARWLPAALFLASACGGGDGPTGPAPSDAVALEVTPGALLFAASGEEQQLKAWAVDEDGTRSEVSATFESSDPAFVAVTTDGLATGGSGVGSSQIVARSGGLTSAPVLALRATPADGALLVADSQVIGAISAVDPAAAYAPGWRYRVRLRNAAPSVGQIVLATGGAPVGGRVVSVSGDRGERDVVLELIGIGVMFAAISIDQQLSLAHADLVVPDALRRSFRVSRPAAAGVRFDGGGKLRFTPSPARPSANRSRIEQEFDLGPFECKAEVPPGFVFPLTADVFSFDLGHTLSLDFALVDGVLERFVVTGGIAPRIAVNPRLTGALAAEAECKIQLATLVLPVGGPLSLIFGGQVPLGVGFSIGASATFGDIGFDAVTQAAVSASFGIDCAAQCRVVSAITTSAPGSSFKPVLPAFSTAFRLELTASAFGWGELAIGSAVLNDLQFEAVELKAGLEQKLELTDRVSQAADPAYASSASLTPVIEAKAAADLEAIANLLEINLASLTFNPTIAPIARTPHGTFTIAPATVAAGTATALGPLATFTVTLNDVDYLGAYAVEGVEIRWQRTNGSILTLEPGRPGCTDLAAAQGQSIFSCTTDFLAGHTGTQTFYAFVKARIWGVPLPVALEVSNNGVATVTVTPANAATVTLGWDGGLPVGAEARLSVAHETDPALVCNVIYQPVPSPLTSAASSCQLAGGSGTSSWTGALPSGPGVPFIITGGGSIAAAASGATSPNGWRALSSGFFSVFFTVSGASVQYSLTGNVQVTGYQGTDWPVWARAALSQSPSGTIATAFAGSQLGTPPGPMSMPLAASGTLAPGKYVITGSGNVGTGPFPPGARTGTAAYSFQLTLTP